MNKKQIETNEVAIQNDIQFYVTTKRLLSYRLPSVGYIQKEFPWGDFPQILINFKDNIHKTEQMKK